MRNLIPLVLFAFAIQSCSSPDALQEITIENRYSIALPSFLTKTDVLNDDASLQYMNGAREFYVIVIDESKEEFHEAVTSEGLEELYPADLSGYANLLLDRFTSAAKVKSKSKMTETTINGMPALEVTIAAAFDDVDVFCSLAYIEGKQDYYQVFAWTLKKHEKEYKADLMAIAKTLKEL